MVVCVLAGCSAGGGGATRTTLPPNVVPERASAWTTITVTATGGPSATVPEAMTAKAAPLLTARLLASPESPASYGLDAPSATLVYAGPTRTRTVVIGKKNFDGRGYYVRRKGDSRVFLVPADQLGPILALVGIR